MSYHRNLFRALLPNRKFRDRSMWFQLATAILFAMAFLAVYVIKTQAPVWVAAQQQVQNVETTDSDPGANESPWRYTRFGWQNPADWLRTPSTIDISLIAKINPLLLSVDIFLAVLGALIWSSDEYQVARLLGRIK